MTAKPCLVPARPCNSEADEGSRVRRFTPTTQAEQCTMQQVRNDKLLDPLHQSRALVSGPMHLYCFFEAKSNSTRTSLSFSARS